MTELTPERIAELRTLADRKTLIMGRHLYEPLDALVDAYRERDAAKADAERADECRRDAVRGGMRMAELATEREASLAKVRELHQPVDLAVGKVRILAPPPRLTCRACASIYPCPTIQALGEAP